MKTDLLQMKEVYQNMIRDNTPASRESCPSPEDLVLLVRTKLSRRERAKIMEHAVGCHLCLREIKKLLDITNQESKLIRDLSELLNADAHEKSPQGRPFARRLSWNYIFVATFVVLFGVVVTYSILHRSSATDLRRGPTAKIRLVSPVDKAVSRQELKFVWEELPRARYYVVEAVDGTLSLIWRSEPVMARELYPPPDVIEKFKPDGNYYWKVTAVQEGGGQFESLMKPFSIKK